MRIILFITTALLVFSCKPEWSDDAKTDFMNGCLVFTSSEDMEEEDREGYCSCLLEKYQAKYKDDNWKQADAQFVHQADSACLVEMGYFLEKKDANIQGGY